MKFIKKHLFAFRFAFALIMLVASLIIENLFETYTYSIALPLTILGYIAISYDLYIEAFKSIKEKEFFDEVTLTIIASIAAMVIGEFVDGLAVTMFFQLGEHFEEYALNNSRKSIKAILALRPDSVRLIINDKERVINPEEAKINDIFLVKPGEIVPLDGIVVSGKSSLNTSSITGESMPRDIKEDEVILSGVVNLNSPLLIRATKVYYDSTVAKILDMVENANKKKTKSEKFITKFAKIYTPIVISIAFSIAIIPPLFYGFIDGNWQTWSDWIYRGASMLVVACPCAIVISVPMSYVVSIGTASKMKILIKGSTYIELLNKANSICLDKTGTITEGKFKIDQINPSLDFDTNELLRLTKIGESFSNHPIAKTICNGEDFSIEKPYISDYKEIPLILGNTKILEDYKITHDTVKEIGTIIYVAYNHQYCGNLVIRDVIKNNTFEAIKMIKKSGIKNITMLTGDNEEIANDIAQKTGITDFKANLLPIDKTKVLESAKNNHEVTLFAGDGVNDAPSLVLSDIGISMGTIGSDSAIEASDIVIMDDDLRKISYLKSLAKINRFVVYYNISFSIVIKVAVLLLNAFGLLGNLAIAAAIFADVGVTIICCINSLLIGLKRK